jgi:hypothetical protein
LDNAEHVGRINVARKVRDVLQEIAPVVNRRLTNAFEETGRGWSLFLSAWALLSGLTYGRLVPMQSALFAAGARNQALLVDCLNSDVVYLDGIRTLLFIRRLRRAAPALRLVVDLDDLMSRRYEHLTRGGVPISFGYLERILPPAILRAILLTGIASVILKYERVALRNAEREILRLADSVVLLNRLEAEMLQTTGDDVGGAPVVAIPPSATPIGRPTRAALPCPANRWHAIFVGSDMLTQNRTTIAYLLDLWSTFGIETELRIYGRQERRWPVVDNVAFCGYVSDIATAYQPGSILVYPCLVPGGIKTKVLEAFVYHVPVVGNALTFEGILPTDYPLVVEDQADLVALLKNPESRGEELLRAVSVASAYLQREHSEDSFAQRWREVIAGPTNERDTRYGGATNAR